MVRRQWVSENIVRVRTSDFVVDGSIQFSTLITNISRLCHEGGVKNAFLTVFSCYLIVKRSKNHDHDQPRIDFLSHLANFTAKRSKKL